MTKEEKAKAYDEALERAKELYNDAITLQLEQDIKDYEYIFPELAENRDEKIRKALIRFHKSTIDVDGIKGEDIIAWLEKQGEQKSIDNLTQQEAMDIAVAKCFNEQKPVDKVEPTFKVGDWVVNNTTKDVFLIKSFNSGYCTLEDIKGNIISPCLPQCESESHLWTIQDVKDGDVLANCNIICIYKKRESEHLIKVYLTYSIAEGVEVTDDTIGDFNLYPATKEVRDTLFTKMKEAGYEWNAELKKVSKITTPADVGFEGLGKVWAEEAKDKKPTWSEEDDYNLQCMIAKVTSDIQKGNVGRNHELIDWLKSLKEKFKKK